MDTDHSRKVALVPEMLFRLLTRDRRRSGTLAVLVQRAWPAAVAAYLILVAASPLDKPLYGLGQVRITAACFYATAALLLASAISPRRNLLAAAAFGATSWSMMGRACAYALDGPDLWTRVIAASAYALLTVAATVVYFVHAAIAVEQQVRAGGGIDS